jgi:hypothetical protein
VADFVTLSGDLGLSKTGDATTGELVAVGQNINAALTAGSAAFAKLNNASFGLKTSAGKTAFELKNGSFEAAIDGLADLKADSVLVQYTSAGNAVAANTALSAGGLNYTFAEAITANTKAFALKGFSANVADFVTLSGDLGLSKTGDATTGELVAVGQNINAALTAGSAAYARLNNASFGLKTSAGKTAFELKNGSFEAGIDGLADLKADSVLVQYTSADNAVAGQYRLERRRPELHLCRSDHRQHKSLCAQGL